MVASASAIPARVCAARGHFIAAYAAACSSQLIVVGSRAAQDVGSPVPVIDDTGLLVSYFFAASLRCQASSVVGVTGKTPAQRPRGMKCASAANQARSPGSYRTRPTGRRSTAFSCRSTSSSASFT